MSTEARKQKSNDKKKEKSSDVSFRELCLCFFSLHFKLDKSLHNVLCRLNVNNVSQRVLSLQEFAIFVKLEVQITFPSNFNMKI